MTHDIRRIIGTGFHTNVESESSIFKEALYARSYYLRTSIRGKLADQFPVPIRAPKIPTPNRLAWPKPKRGTSLLFSHPFLLYRLFFRTIIVRLISTAQTGYFYTKMRPRVSPKLHAIKYDPVGVYIA